MKQGESGRKKRLSHRRHRIPPPSLIIPGERVREGGGDLPRLPVSFLALHGESEPIPGCRTYSIFESFEDIAA